MDSVDKMIINSLQEGFPISDRPFADTATKLGLDETDLIDRVERLRDGGTLSRFGPLYHAERLGGGLTLAAMQVPEADFERVTDLVNQFPEVAHNYARDHTFNMWFVVATEVPDRINQVIQEIEALSGYSVYNMPKLDEYFIGLKFTL
ncbi:Lrp/AsnC family transcriptional regulator [Pseudomonadota bacterium]